MTLVALLPPRHNNEDKGYLLHVVVVSYKGVDGEQLRERLKAKLKCAIDTPGFDLVNTSICLSDAKTK